jgi:hypothetical protein
MQQKNPKKIGIEVISKIEPQKNEQGIMNIERKN